MLKISILLNQKIKKKKNEIKKQKLNWKILNVLLIRSEIVVEIKSIGLRYKNIILNVF